MSAGVFASPDERGDWDVLVVGAGPAGAVAAREVARAGARALLVDRAAFPRPKVCGACLNLRAMGTLDRLGLAERIGALGPRTLRRVRLAAGGAEAALALPGGCSLSRERFDEALAQAAVEAGATFRPATRATLLARPADGAWVAAELASLAGEAPSVVRARVVIAADGLGGAFAAERLGGERFGGAGRVGAGATLDAEDVVERDEDAVNLAVGRDGYVGLVRLEDGRWNLAAALDPSATRREGGIAPVVAGILRDAGWRVPPGVHRAAWRGTPRLWRAPRRVAAERLFVAGDAGGYVEPFTGEGMAWALAAGRAVAPFALRAAARWDPSLVDEWTRAWREDVHGGQLAIRLAARVLGHPRMVHGVTGVLAAWPSLATPVIGHLNAVAAGHAKGGAA